MSDDLDDVELYAYLKTNVSAEMPSLVCEARKQAGMANSSDWVRDRLITALVDELGIDGDELRARQPSWGNGKGATSPEYIARRYGKPWPPEDAAANPGEKVSQGG